MLTRFRTLFGTYTLLEDSLGNGHINMEYVFMMLITIVMLWFTLKCILYLFRGTK